LEKTAKIILSFDEGKFILNFKNVSLFMDLKKNPILNDVVMHDEILSTKDFIYL